MYVNFQNNISLQRNKTQKYIYPHISRNFFFSIVYLSCSLWSEVLEDPSLIARLADTKAAGETKALQQFMTLFGTNPDRAYYGIKHVEKANNAQAIETLLVSDTLFRYGGQGSGFFFFVFLSFLFLFTPLAFHLFVIYVADLFHLNFNFENP